MRRLRGLSLSMVLVVATGCSAPAPPAANPTSPPPTAPPATPRPATPAPASAASTPTPAPGVPAAAPAPTRAQIALLPTRLPRPTVERLVVTVPPLPTPTETPVPLAADIWDEARRQLEARGSFRYLATLSRLRTRPANDPRQAVVEIRGTYRDRDHWQVVLHHRTLGTTLEWLALGPDEAWFRRDGAWERLPLAEVAGERADVEFAWIWGYLIGSMGDFRRGGERELRPAGVEAMNGLPALRYENVRNTRGVWNGEQWVHLDEGRLWVAQDGGYIVAAEGLGVVHLNARSPEDRWFVRLEYFDVGQPVEVPDPAARDPAAQWGPARPGPTPTVLTPRQLAAIPTPTRWPGSAPGGLGR